MLQATGLTKSYRGRRVVDDVSLGLAPGEIVGLLGPNGAGKTTTFHMMVGLASPDGGRVLLEGEDITRLPMYRRARAGISYLPQEASVFRKLTVGENILCIAETLPLTPAGREERVVALLEEFGIDHLRHQGAHTLSGGERRRLEIARALVLTPRFILLDEPFAGIDPLAVVDIQRIVGALSRQGIGILITDHNVRETLNITDRAYIINNGKILREGSPDALTRDDEVRRVYLGENFRLA
ncbi:MAG: LPS export ABC transporter ATP-binding protein [Acidobacteria bacterium]|jgi:lipopolysaccharide export system ATP-binding protein|nr:LPS export ABC transporter ATP-binding protein [Acidobacteriota bacterium]